MRISRRRFSSDVVGRALVEHLGGVGPVDEIGVVGDAALQRDRLVLGAAESLEDDGVAALFVFDHVGGALQRSDLADPATGVVSVPK